ncbi:MAG: hypothetical protein Q7S92_03725 [Candidatus Diapherotrites archaeon]|nr:hypothetical protein [Candidatus Diapherotrites archaeon]
MESKATLLILLIILGILFGCTQNNSPAIISDDQNPITETNPDNGTSSGVSTTQEVPEDVAEGIQIINEGLERSRQEEKVDSAVALNMKQVREDCTQAIDFTDAVAEACGTGFNKLEVDFGNTPAEYRVYAGVETEKFLGSHACSDRFRNDDVFNSPSADPNAIRSSSPIEIGIAKLTLPGQTKSAIEYITNDPNKFYYGENLEVIHQFSISNNSSAVVLKEEFASVRNNPGTIRTNVLANKGSYIVLIAGEKYDHCIQSDTGENDISKIESLTKAILAKLPE